MSQCVNNLSDWLRANEGFFASLKWNDTASVLHAPHVGAIHQRHLIGGSIHEEFSTK